MGLIALSRPGAGETAAGSVELRVALVDTTGLEDEARDGLKREVEAIYLAGGARLLWLDESSMEGESHVVRVYLMDVIPPSLAARHRAFSGDPMAFALGRSGLTSGSTIYVSRAAVARIVTGGAAVEPDAATMARALGRIVAHELAHGFLQREHTRRGILTAALGAGDLVGPREAFFFTARQRAQLQELGRTVVESETVAKPRVP